MSEKVDITMDPRDGYWGSVQAGLSGKFSNSSASERKQAFGTRSSSHKQLPHRTHTFICGHGCIIFTFQLNLRGTLQLKSLQSLHTFRHTCGIRFLQFPITHSNSKSILLQSQLILYGFSPPPLVSAHPVFTSFCLDCQTVQEGLNK